MKLAYLNKRKTEKPKVELQYNAKAEAKKMWERSKHQLPHIKEAEYLAEFVKLAKEFYDKQGVKLASSY